MSARTWWKRFTSEAKPVEPPVRCGIFESVRSRGRWVLCGEDTEIKGVTVKIVTVPRELHRRFWENSQEAENIQGALNLLPKSLRPRKKTNRTPAKETAGV